MKLRIIALILLCALLFCSCGGGKDAENGKSVLDQDRYDIRNGANDISTRITGVFPLIENAKIKELPEQKVEFDDSVVYALGEYKITSRMYYYIISTEKAARIAASQDNEFYGDDTEGFWESYYGRSDKTQKEYVMETLVNDYCIMLITSKALFDELGLEESENIELTRQNILEQFGSKEQFNNAYAGYGITFDEYIEYFRYIDCYYTLYDYLYGENGKNKQTEEEEKKYFNDHYAKIKQLLFTFTKAGENGYDVPKPENEVAERRETAEKVFSRITSGERTFESFVYIAEDDEGATVGYVIAEGDTSKPLDEAVFSMEPGDIKLVETRMGMHIVKRDTLMDEEFESYREIVQSRMYAEDFKESRKKYTDKVVIDEQAKNKYEFYDVI